MRRLADVFSVFFGNNHDYNPLTQLTSIVGYPQVVILNQRADNRWTSAVVRMPNISLAQSHSPAPDSGHHHGLVPELKRLAFEKADFVVFSASSSGSGMELLEFVRPRSKE